MIGWQIAAVFCMGFSIMFGRLAKRMQYPEERRLPQVLGWASLALALICMFIGIGNA